MPIESAFADLMPDTITIVSSTGLNAYGKRNYGGTSTQHQCRVRYENSLIKMTDGREVVSTGKAYIYGTSTATTDHRLILPDGSDAIIIAVETPGDEDGAHHTVIHFGN